MSGRGERGGRQAPAGASARRSSRVGVLVLAGVVYWQSAVIPVSPLYAKVGPTVVPMMTAIALAVLGVLLLVAALRGGWQSEAERELTIDRAALFGSPPG